MIYIEKNDLKLSDKIIKFTKNGIEKERYIGPEGVSWWNELESKHDNTEIIEIADVSYTQEELERYEEVKNITTSFDEVKEYVKTGDISVFESTDDEKVRNFLATKENKLLQEELKSTQQALDFMIMNRGV